MQKQQSLKQQADERMATTKGRMGASSTILNPLNSINKMGNVLGNNILIKKSRRLT